MTARFTHFAFMQQWCPRLLVLVANLQSDLLGALGLLDLGDNQRRTQ